MMPSQERLKVLIEMSEAVEQAQQDYREAMNRFTQAASDLNYALLEEEDYRAYIYQRQPIPEWMKLLPSKKWFFEPRHKPTQKPRKARYKPKKQKPSFSYSVLMEKFTGGEDGNQEGK